MRYILPTILYPLLLTIFCSWSFLEKKDPSEDSSSETKIEQAPDPLGNTPLHIAVSKGLLDSIHPLLESVDIETKNALGMTPLHIAILEGKEEILEELIRFGANPTSPISLNFGDQTIDVIPAQLAILRGEKNAFDHLVASEKIQVGEMFSSLGNPLHLAVDFDQAEMLEHLLQKYSAPIKHFIESPNQKGQTPFSLAASNGNVQCMTILKKYQANIEAEDYLRRRPIHHAAIHNDQNAIKYLAYCGVELEPRDNERKTPEDLATKKSIKNLLVNLSRMEDEIQNLPPSFQENPPENLVFKGGGAKGLCYVGAIKELEKHGFLNEVFRVAGTSAGAISSALLAFGYSGEEMSDLLVNTNFLSFLDHPLSKEKISHAKKNQSFGTIINSLWETYKIISRPFVAIIEGIKRLWHTTGICDGEAPRKWIEEHIKQKTIDQENPNGIDFFTFGELRNAIEEGKEYKHLHVFATKGGNIPEIVRFSSEDPSCDHLIISDAVIASMSIPGVFKPHTLHVKMNGSRIPWKDGGAMLDGGMLYNFPIEAFDSEFYQEKGIPLNQFGAPRFNRRTLGLNLYSSTSDPKNESEINTVGDLLHSITEIYYSAEEVIRATVPYNTHRVLDIDTQDVGTLEFNLSPQRQKLLIESGRKAVHDFIFNQIPFNESLFVPNRRFALHQKNKLSLPYPASHFIGRKKELDELTLSLVTADPSNNGSNVKFISGSSGSGKTELAYTFADQNISNFGLIWKIDGSTEQSTHQDYLELAKALDLNASSQLELGALIQMVNQALERHNNFDPPYLLIFDQLTASVPYPQKGGSVIITGEKSPYKNPLPELSINPFAPAESTALLSKMIGKNPTREMEQLSHFLHNFPPLICLAGSYIKQTGTPYETYEGKIKSLSSSQRKELSEKEQFLVAALSLSLKHLEMIDPVSAEFFRDCAFLGVNPNTLFFCRQWLLKNGHSLSQVAKVMENLEKFSLINHNHATLSFTIQSSLSQSLNELIPEAEKKQRYQKLAHIISDMKTHLPEQATSTWKAEIERQRIFLLEHPLAKELDTEIRAKLGS